MAKAHKEGQGDVPMDTLDTHNVVFDTVKTAILAHDDCPAELVTGNIVSSLDANIAATPRVVMQELNIITKSYTLDYDNYKKVITWQTDIYCSGSAAESQCRAIAKIVNSIFQGDLHFEQVSGGKIEFVDTVTKRYTLRHTGTFDETDGVFK